MNETDVAKRILLVLEGLANCCDEAWRMSKEDADKEWFLPGGHIQNEEAAAPGERYLKAHIGNDGRCRIQFIISNQRLVLERLYHDLTGEWPSSPPFHGPYIEAIK